MRHHFPVTETYVVPMRSPGLPEWAAVLRDCGKPDTVVVLDFETYFDDEYKMMGKGEGLSTVEYIRDARFEMLGLGALIVRPDNLLPDYENDTFFQAGHEMVETQIRCLQKQYGDQLERCTVVFQNAPFDAMILALVFGIYPPHVIDTLALARHWNSRANNDLESQAKRWDLPAKGDTSQFKGLTFRVRLKKPKGRKKGPKLPVQVPKITPEQVEALKLYTRNDVMREWELFTLLLPRLSRPDFELRVMHITLEMFTKPTIGVNFERGTELIGLMNAEIDRVLGEAGVTDRDQISGDKSFEALLFDALAKAGDSPVRYIKYGKNNQALLAIAKDDPERKELENHADEQVRKLMAARLALDSWPLHIRRVERIMGQARAGGGLLHVPLKYHGAHTGRDSGGEKINLQNLGSRGHALVNAVRELLVAPPGRRLVIVDLSSIEAVVLAWIAGEEELIAAFREQFAAGDAATVDVYTRFASRFLKIPIRKPKKNGIPQIEKRHKRGRAIGKIGVLGCGYGMGTDRIFEYAATMGTPLTMEEADGLKVAYRESNPKIVQFWKDIERAFVYTAKYKKPCELPRGLRFDSAEDCDVIITLPCGRELHYHRVKLIEEERGEKIEVYNEVERHWGHVWGGHLTENVVQAMSRDILMEAALDLEAMRHHVALRVHDELVFVEDEATAEACHTAAIARLRRPPAWAPDCPLNAEGVIRQQYGDH